MNSDIVDLRSFYASLLGRLAERSIAMALASVWANLPRERLIGLGYALPVAGPFRQRCGARLRLHAGDAGRREMAGLGTVGHRAGLRRGTAAGRFSIDRMLLVHLLEHAENPRETLKEIWRVLSPAGRVVIVVPNRRGVWARFEHTPFGTGRPFSQGQLNELLREANFTPAAWADALFFPPSKRRWMMRFHNLLERSGRRLWPIFSGVIVVEAQKRIYQGLPLAQRASRRVFMPVLSPQGATRSFLKTLPDRHRPGVKAALRETNAP